MRDAIAEIDRQTATQVLIIEDEPLISLDLSEIVESLGHGVTTIARTADQAVAGGACQPAGARARRHPARRRLVRARRGARNPRRSSRCR